MSNMKARLVLTDRIEFADDAVAHLMVWAVPQPVPPAAHSYKYRLAYVVKGLCVLRYDNERGKGDHRHAGGVETAYRFTGVDALLDDFLADIARWNHENGVV